MTRRATHTQAELARAIRAADSTGKVAVWTRLGIAFVESDNLPIGLPSGDEGGEAECDKAFGVTQ